MNSDKNHDANRLCVACSVVATSQRKGRQQGCMDASCYFDRPDLCNDLASGQGACPQAGPEIFVCVSAARARAFFCVSILCRYKEFPLCLSNLFYHFLAHSNILSPCSAPFFTAFTPSRLFTPLPLKSAHTYHIWYTAQLSARRILYCPVQQGGGQILGCCWDV